jgi:SagB-type dehydrogenase family enzyme
MKMLTCDLVRALFPFTFAAFGLAGSPLSGFAGDPGPGGDSGPSLIRLPQPRQSGATSVEAALAARRSLRSFSNKPVTLEELSQLLWAAQGITHPRGFRTAPSAGALYPLELVVIAGTVAALPAGTYRYEPDGHHLVPVAEGDQRAALADAALGQSPIRKASLVIAIIANERKTTIKYGERGVRYVHLEAGHAAQNICLQAEALGLGSVMIGAFSDRDVASLLRSAGRQPLYLIPLGRK